ENEQTRSDDNEGGGHSRLPDEFRPGEGESEQAYDESRQRAERGNPRQSPDEVDEVARPPSPACPVESHAGDDQFLGHHISPFVSSRAPTSRRALFHD